MWLLAWLGVILSLKMRGPLAGTLANYPKGLQPMRLGMVKPRNCRGANPFQVGTVVQGVNT